jgi:methyl-accepting chemotaxis protein
MFAVIEKMHEEGTMRRLWLKTSLQIAGLMTALLVPFVFYDVHAQRRALEDALLQKGKSIAISGAAAVGHVLKDAIASGRLTEEQAFDIDYRPIPGTDPQKYHTVYDSFTDANILEIQDAYLEDPDAQYAVSVDVNAYLPTHNSRYAKPLTGDYEKDLVGNRTKRIFDDFDPILAAAQSTDPFLHQVYYRDTGEVLWNVSAPIWVNGRHWGSFITGFSLQRVDALTAVIIRRTVMAAWVLVVAISAAAFFVARSIARPILRLRDAATALAGGELAQKIHVNSKDEVGELAAALDAAISTWREIIGGLRDDAIQLSTTAAELAASSEELSRTTGAQSDEISHTSSAVEEMLASIREVAQNAEHAAQAATASSQRAQDGEKLAADTAAGLEQADRIMQGLRTRSDEIGTIVNLIQEIAAQTNILALNAAIEAAGAGAAGARFDVVAEEIRKLAGRTTQATGEIAQLIGTVQTDTQAAAKAFSEGAAMARESGVSLAEIVKSSTSVTDMVQNISSATAEQSLASAEIANSIDTMVGGSQQTAEATRETAQIGVELSNLAERLKEAAGQFKV